MNNGWSIGCKVIAWLTLVAGIVTGIALAVEFNSFWPVLAGVGSSLATFMLFGTLGYMTAKINSLISDSEDGEEEEDENERQARLKKLYDQGALTEEEYKRAIFEEPEQPTDSDNNWSGRLT